MTRQEKVDLVRASMQERFPDCHCTIRILLWDDGTDLYECRYGVETDVGVELHRYIHYNGKLEYDIDHTRKHTSQWTDECGFDYLRVDRYIDSLN